MRIIGQAAAEFAINNSEFSISEDDVSLLSLLCDKNINELCINAELNKMTLEEFAKDFGATIEGLKQMVTEPIARYIKLMLIGMEYAKEDNSIPANEEKYELYLKDEAENHCISYEDAKRVNSYETFFVTRYRSIVYTEIFDFCQKEVYCK